MKNSVTGNILVRSLIVFGILSVLLVISIPKTQAQRTDQWSVPRQIPNYDLTGRAPILVADQNRSVHAFNYQSVSTGYAIVYRRWSPETGWTPPVDIIIPTLGAGSQTIQGVHLDDSGYFHLIFSNAPETSGTLYYSKALASIADRSTSWSKPVIIGPRASPLPFAGIIGIKDRLVVLYCGEVAGTGLYEVHSLDKGVSWSHPRIVARNLIRDQWPASIRMVFDDKGTLHVVWGNVNATGVGDEIRYARLDPDFTQWSLSVVLATREENEYSITWPSIISNDDQLIVIYQDSFPATRWMRVSNDRGDSWAMPVRPFPEIGEYENAVLLKDSNQNIHMVLGNRTSTSTVHGMWYSRWLGGNWTPLVPIISGPNTSRFDPSAPQAVLVQGNIIMATWWHNVRNDMLTGAWYSYTYLNAPQDDLIPLPSPTPVPTQTITPNLLENQNSDQMETSPGPMFNNDPQAIGNPSTPIFIALVPVAVLIPILIIFRRRIRK